MKYVCYKDLLHYSTYLHTTDILLLLLIFYELIIVFIFKVGAIPEIRMRCNYTNFKMNIGYGYAENSGLVNERTTPAILVYNVLISTFIIHNIF